MKNLYTQFIASLFILSTFPGLNLAQAPDLGSAANFVLFTVDGALGNTANSHINGSIGTNVGAITGFDPTTIMGTIESANTLTAQVSMDVQAAYLQLFNTAATVTDHAPVFGGGETLLPGVYSIAAAGSISGTLILNAQGNPNAVFIFKFGGAFSTAAGASVTLINGASANNVFWIAEGAIPMAAGTNMQGTLIAHNGAISMGAIGTLVGRMFSTIGAATIYASRLSLTPFPFLNPGQAPDLGVIAGFALYTTAGAIDNTGTSIITGDIGTNIGAITGYEPPSVVNGSIENANSITAQAAVDLDAAYVQLYFTPANFTSHTPAFGGGETLTPGVYSIAAAGSIGGNLILDGQGDPNAVFIFKFGGAFTTGASATVMLINGVAASNVFWIAEGAIAMAASTTMKGTLIANNGAISMGANGTLQGRMLSTTGAISTYANTITIEDGSFALPIQLYSFTGNCNKQKVLLEWSTATEIENNFFSIERSEEGLNWHILGTITGSGNSNTIKHYSYTDNQPSNKKSFYRLKQTDITGFDTYGADIAIKNCYDQSYNFSIYPNPSKGQFDLLCPGAMDHPCLIEIYNVQGQKVYTAFNFISKFDLGNKAPGIYFMNVQMNSNPKWLKLVLQ
ncbi:MAG: ice-binding family protein [Saprospiraceae bacterium]